MGSLPRSNWVYYSLTYAFVSASNTGSPVINQNLKLLIPIIHNVWSLEMATEEQILISSPETSSGELLSLLTHWKLE